jgi:hypothetical protein
MKPIRPSEPASVEVARDASASFAPARLGPSRRGATLPLVVVAVVAMALVGVGVAGRVMSSTSNDRAAPSAVARLASPAAASADAPDGIGQLGVAPEPVAFTVSRVTGSVEVRGTVGLRSVTYLRVDVLDANGRVQASHPLAVDDPDGGLRPASTRTFLTTFPVLSANASWPLWVQVTAFDAVGGMIGALTQALVPGTALLKVPLKVNQTYLR